MRQPGDADEGYPPLTGDASVVLAMRKLGAEQGWTEQELLRRAEAVRRKIRAIRLNGGEVRNPSGFALTLLRVMENAEVAQFLTQPMPQAAQPWWKDKLATAQEQAQARESARVAAVQSQEAPPADPDYERRRRRVLHGKFNAASTVAARGRLLGAGHAALPRGVADRINRTPEEADGEQGQ